MKESSWLKSKISDAASSGSSHAFKAVTYCSCPAMGRVIRIVDGERGGKIHEHDADFQNGAHFLVAEHTAVVLHDGDQGVAVPYLR